MHTGIDIISVERMRKAATAKFIGRVFTDREASWCLSRKDPARSFALVFAAKEACLKALSTGLSKGIRWKDVEVEARSGEGPVLRLYCAAKESLGQRKAFLSVAHSSGYAFALVAIE